MIKLSDSTINLLLTSYIIVQDNALPIKLGAIQERLLSSILLNIVPEVLVLAIYWVREKNKRYTD